MSGRGFKKRLRSLVYFWLWQRTQVQFLISTFGIHNCLELQLQVSELFSRHRGHLHPRVCLHVYMHAPHRHIHTHNSIKNNILKNLWKRSLCLRPTSNSVLRYLSREFSYFFQRWDINSGVRNTAINAFPEDLGRWTSGWENLLNQIWKSEFESQFLPKKLDIVIYACNSSPMWECWA